MAGTSLREMGSSLPPCGEGGGMGVVPHGERAPSGTTPTPTPPHKGEGLPRLDVEAASRP